MVLPPNLKQNESTFPSIMLLNIFAITIALFLSLHENMITKLQKPPNMLLSSSSKYMIWNKRITIAIPITVTIPVTYSIPIPILFIVIAITIANAITFANPIIRYHHAPSPSPLSSLSHGAIDCIISTSIAITITITITCGIAITRSRLIFIVQFTARLTEGQHRLQEEEIQTRWDESWTAFEWWIFQEVCWPNSDGDGVGDCLNLSEYRKKTDQSAVSQARSITRGLQRIRQDLVATVEQSDNVQGTLRMAPSPSPSPSPPPSPSPFPSFDLQSLDHRPWEKRLERWANFGPRLVLQEKPRHKSNVEHRQVWRWRWGWEWRHTRYFVAPYRWWWWWWWLICLSCCRSNLGDAWCMFLYFNGCICSP